MAELECAYERFCEVFKVSSLYREQIKAIEACLSQKNVYASLPIEYGKLMIYFALLMYFTSEHKDLQKSLSFLLFKV